MEMAIRAAATARPPPPSTPPYAPKTTSSSSLLPKTTKPKSQFKPISLSIPTTISLFALITSPNDAKAFTISKEQVVSSVTDVQNALDQVEEVGSGVLDFSQRVTQAVIDVLKPTVDLGLPILQKAGDEALKLASPVISKASKKTQEALQSSGIDTEPVFSAAKTVAGAAQQTTKVIVDAKPIASSTLETITSADPIVIAATAGALVVTCLLFPPIWSTISYNLRGFKGMLTPAQTLDLLSTQNYIMVDVRSEKDKNKAGIPRLPSGAKNKMISIPLEELPSKLKGPVRSTKNVEADLAALKISYLKRINKGSKFQHRDHGLIGVSMKITRNSDTAKLVAKTLTSLGFKNCWVMADGFSGGKGWVQSRLGADSYNLSFAEIVSPSRVIPAAARRFGTTSSTTVQSSRKFLLGGSD